ncbi:MAG: cobalamin biosynthesis protein, partial [Kiritimatiellaeota bacterium]|nr:cobalamin biosynthesis protein [Kiritimatiellota bacterium]
LPEEVYREYYGGKRNVSLISDFREIDFGKFDGAVVASGNPEPAEAEIPVLRILIPETGGIVVGIGCRKGVSRDEVADAVETMLSSNSLKVSDVDFLASCDVKRNESGLLEFAAAIDAEIRFFSVDELKGIEVPTPSERVNERIGCPSVSEAAALAASQGRLIAPKRKFERVTVALAERQGGRKRKSCK